MFSITERDRRYGAACDAMKSAGLQAVYITGNSTVGTNAFGCYRYFANSRVIFFMASMVLFENGQSVAVVNNPMGKINLVNNSFIEDAIVNQDQLGGVIEILKSRGIDSGRVGILTEVIPASWFIRLRKELPNVEFVEAADILYPVRSEKSAEEAEVQRMCAKIADAGYKAVCETIKPGMYESEVVAEMEKAMQKMGADENFSLVTSGKFSVGKNDLMPLHNYSAVNRKIEVGDVVAMEITPRYRGYWTQLVRTICVGEHNADAEKFRQVVVGAVDEAKKVLRANITIGEVVKKMREYTEAAGCTFAMPCGHIASVDLNEDRLMDDYSRRLTPGMLVIIHPTILLDGMQTGIFWGESYIITEDGFESPMESGNELYTVKV